MSKSGWQKGVPTGNQLATYRGIRIVVRLDERGNPLEIGWFIGGHVAKSMPVSCDLESAKIIGTAAVDARIPLDERWAEAERRDRESELWNNA
jgi:hypothetical protein